MDIVVEKLARFLIPLFIYCWWGCVFLVITYGILHNSGDSFKVWPKRLVLLLLAPCLGYFVALFLALALLRSIANDHLDALAEKELTRLVVTSKAGVIEIEDPVAIQELLELLRDQPRAWGHHSHPASEYQLFFPEIGYTYSLGLDSQVANEYWLRWVGYPGSNPNLSSIANLRQVRSEEITEWLERHVPED